MLCTTHSIWSSAALRLGRRARRRVGKPSGACERGARVHVHLRGRFHAVVGPQRFNAPASASTIATDRFLAVAGTAYMAKVPPRVRICSKVVLVAGLENECELGRSPPPLIRDLHEEAITPPLQIRKAR